MALHRHLAMVVLLTVGPAVHQPWAGGGSGHTATGFSPAGLAVIEWGIARFAEAGLPLPDIDFTQHGSTGSCRGRPGWYQRNGARSTIDICVDRSRPSMEFLVLHELAHAWDSHQLTDDRRQAFLDMRGLRQWWGTDAEHWGDFGAEQAAEVMVWALFDRPVRLVRVPEPHDDCTHLLAAHRALTGRSPVHGYTDLCRAGD
jgi:hypothetical protein